MMLDSTVEIPAKYLIYRPLAVPSKDVSFGQREIAGSSSENVGEPASHCQVHSWRQLCLPRNDWTLIVQRIAMKVLWKHWKVMWRL
jgi:hypothetical protein